MKESAIGLINRKIGRWWQVDSFITELPPPSLALRVNKFRSLRGVEGLDPHIEIL